MHRASDFFSFQHYQKQAITRHQIRFDTLPVLCCIVRIKWSNKTDRSTTWLEEIATHISLP
ncbi:hypothetical protein [Xenorhabdus bovienii]|uniref:hypothetical protein n=1 Tax=Xenorhabdus bovienii TaxID=40576 RepID=UPI003DA37A5F